MKLGGLFGKLRDSLSRNKTESQRVSEYTYHVSSGDNIRFHTAPEADTHEMRDELKDIFPNLEEVTFTNLRLEHDSAEDARAAVAEITKRNPLFVIVEGVGAPAHAQEIFNNYVQGRTNNIGDIRPGEFTGTMLRQLRNLKKEGFPVPLLVISDVPSDSNLLGKLSYIERMPDILTERWGDFNEVKKQVLSRVVAYSEAALQRENHVVENVGKQIAAAVQADNQSAKTLDVDSVERLDLLAAYGSAHGTLSGYFRAKGVRTAAIAHANPLHPIESMLSRVKLSVHAKGDFAAKEVDDAVTDAIFAALIERGIPKWLRNLSEYIGKATGREYHLALRKVTEKWRTDAQEGTGPSLQELHAEAQKSFSDFFKNRALPLIRSYLPPEKL